MFCLFLRHIVRSRALLLRMSMACAMCLFTNAVLAQAAQEVLPHRAELALTSLKITPARIGPVAKTSMILAATWAGNRVIAVGEHGVVLLSDDAGHAFRQAKSVPVSSTLNSVNFVDAKVGWAVGHWGAILKTIDGGETWKLQRSDVKVDQPLFSVYFKNAHEGWAVGLWSLLLTTRDGGATWDSVSLPNPPGASKADRNLFCIFPDRSGGLAISAERGAIIRSEDDGKTWAYVDTGYKGSLWAGTVLDDGTWLTGGLRGSILRSADQGQSWQASPTGTKSSITQIIQGEDGSIVAIGLDGVVLTSLDKGVSFSTTQRPDRADITAAVIAPGGKLVAFSMDGPLKAAGVAGE
jgi:Photosynthesis system II assembly factor YCF48